MTVVAIEEVKALLSDTLKLDDRLDTFSASAVLLGGIPELDSMAVITLIQAIEDKFDFLVDDDDITAETFDTIGSLTDFINSKLLDGQQV